MSYSSLAQLVQHYESGGNYQAQNPNSSASGAYQFTNATWTQYANQIDPSIAQQYPTAASAPPAVQDQVFAQAVSQNGLNDWTCSGCNPGLSSYLASNPSASSLPIGAGSGAGYTMAEGPGDGVTGGFGSNGVTPGSNPLGGGYVSGDGSYVPPQAIPGATPNASQSPAVSSTAATAASAPGVLLDEPFMFGLVPGLAQGINSWITGAESAVGNWMTGFASNIFSTVGNYAARFGLIIVGVVLLFIALWRLLDPSGSKTASAVKTVAAAAA